MTVAPGKVWEDTDQVDTDGLLSALRDLDAEQALVGRLLRFPDLACRQAICGSLFSESRYKAIVEAVRTAKCPAGDDGSVDLLALQAVVRRGGPDLTLDFLLDVLDARFLNTVGPLVAILTDLARRRESVRVLRAGIRALADLSLDTTAILQDLSGKLLSATARPCA